MKNFTIIILMIWFSVSVAGAITFDGENITGDFANAEWTTFQDVATGWGGADLMAMYVTTNSTHLLIGVPSFGVHNDRRCVIIFIDDNPDTGSNVISAGLNGLTHVKGMAGLSFDTAFTPDRTVTLAIESSGFTYVDIENIVGNSTEYIGAIDVFDFGGVVTNNNNTIVAGYMPWAFSLSETNTAAEGIEIAFAYEDLANNTSTIKVMAVISNFDADWTSNQTLPPSGTNTVGSPSSEHHYELVPGNQFMEIILPTVDTGFYFNASQAQTKLFAQSSVNNFDANAWGGTPPYSYMWKLGNGFETNAPQFTYSYPIEGQFMTTFIVSDNGGQSITTEIGEVTVLSATFVDGLNIPTDFSSAETNVTQDTASNWGEATVPGTGTELDRLFAYSSSRHLNIGICGNMATGFGARALAVFIDSDYSAGSNIISGITTGDPAKIQNLEGLTFDNEFSPDKALIFSIGNWYDFWVDWYELDSNTNTYWSDKTEWHSIFDPFQRVYHEISNELFAVVAFNNLNTKTNFADAVTGVECFLDFDLLYSGLTPQTFLKIQTIIYNHETGYVANQSLPGIGGDSSGYGAASSVNYQNVPGKQYIEISGPIIPEPFLFILPMGLIFIFRKVMI